MSPLRPIVASALVLAACNNGPDDELLERIDQLEKQVAELEKKQAQPAAPSWVGERLNKLELAVEALQSKSVASIDTRDLADLGTVYSLPVDESPGIGPDDAKVVIVEAMEFACPACERSRDFVQQMIEAFDGQSVRIAFKQYIVHPTRATLPARAACAAHKQGEYHRFDDRLWDAYNQGMFDGSGDEEELRALARKYDLDMTKYDRDVAGSCVDHVQREHDAFRAIGTRGTPTFYINGRELDQRTIDRVKEMVAEEMRLADARIAATGTRADQYYVTWIVGKGRTSR